MIPRILCSYSRYQVLEPFLKVFRAVALTNVRFLCRTMGCVRCCILSNPTKPTCDFYVLGETSAKPHCAKVESRQRVPTTMFAVAESMELRE